MRWCWSVLSHGTSVVWAALGMYGHLWKPNIYFTVLWNERYMSQGQCLQVWLVHSWAAAYILHFMQIIRWRVSSTGRTRGSMQLAWRDSQLDRRPHWWLQWKNSRVRKRGTMGCRFKTEVATKKAEHGGHAVVVASSGHWSCRQEISLIMKTEDTWPQGILLQGTDPWEMDWGVYYHHYLHLHLHQEEKRNKENKSFLARDFCKEKKADFKMLADSVMRIRNTIWNSSNILTLHPHHPFNIAPSRPLSTDTHLHPFFTNNNSKGKAAPIVAGG